MRPLHYFVLLPLLGAVATTEDTISGSCETALCPFVKCPSAPAAALCSCIIARETLCKGRCPDYKPDYQGCLVPKLPVKPKPCECPMVSCVQSWPESCICANEAAKNCYKRCGGTPPTYKDCSPDPVIARSPSIPPEAQSDPVQDCECDGIMCIQSWPESCYCENAAAASCYKKCGGPMPNLKKCPVPVSKTLQSLTKTQLSTPTPALPPNPHKVCGGGRSNYQECAAGYTCITDPYTPGCGPACDGLGICVKDKMCGGFGGFRCEEQGQVCHDDPRDDCDPKHGGADCGGLCVWPHRSLYEDPQ